MRIIFAGGGTGGHIYPALAIAKLIKENMKDAEIIFVGTEKGLEMSLVPKEGFKLRTITVSGFKRKISKELLKTMKDLFCGLKEARKIIDEFKPDVVVGTGGYVCGPVLLIAALKGIPTLIHEQNVIPGFTNRILSYFVDKIAVSFEETKQYFHNKNKVIVTGNPIRKEILEKNKRESRTLLGFHFKKPLVLIVGGSRGAEKINQTVMEIIRRGHEKSYQMVVITGEKHYSNFVNELTRSGIDLNNLEDIRIIPFAYNMPDYLSAADLIVCRAGAITVAEVTAIGLPSIIIPSPYVADNHQEYNARLLEKNNASIVILEKDLSSDLLEDVILRVIRDESLLQSMSRNALNLGIRDAADKIFGEVMALLRK